MRIFKTQYYLETSLSGIFIWTVDHFIGLGAWICGLHTNSSILITVIIITMMPNELVITQELGEKAVILCILMEIAEGIYVFSHVHNIGLLMKSFKICSSQRDYKKNTLCG